jgi:hypothetical protein
MPYEDPLPQDQLPPAPALSGPCDTPGSLPVQIVEFGPSSSAAAGTGWTPPSLPSDLAAQILERMPARTVEPGMN